MLSYLHVAYRQVVPSVCITAIGMGVVEEVTPVGESQNSRFLSQGTWYVRFQVNPLEFITDYFVNLHGGSLSGGTNRYQTSKAAPCNCPCYQFLTTLYTTYLDVSASEK